MEDFEELEIETSSITPSTPQDSSLSKKQMQQVMESAERNRESEIRSLSDTLGMVARQQDNKILTEQAIQNDTLDNIIRTTKNIAVDDEGKLYFPDIPTPDGLNEEDFEASRNLQKQAQASLQYVLDKYNSDRQTVGGDVAYIAGSGIRSAADLVAETLAIVPQVGGMAIQAIGTLGGDGDNWAIRNGTLLQEWTAHRLDSLHQGMTDVLMLNPAQTSKTAREISKITDTGLQVGAIAAGALAGGAAGAAKATAIAGARGVSKAVAKRYANLWANQIAKRVGKGAATGYAMAQTEDYLLRPYQGKTSEEYLQYLRGKTGGDILSDLGWATVVGVSNYYLESAFGANASIKNFFGDAGSGLIKMVGRRALEEGATEVAQDKVLDVADLLRGRMPVGEFMSKLIDKDTLETFVISAIIGGATATGEYASNRMNLVKNYKQAVKKAFPEASEKQLEIAGKAFINTVEDDVISKIHTSIIADDQLRNQYGTYNAIVRNRLNDLIDQTIAQGKELAFKNKSPEYQAQYIGSVAQRFVDELYTQAVMREMPINEVFNVNQMQVENGILYMYGTEYGRRPLSQWSKEMTPAQWYKAQQEARVADELQKKQKEQQKAIRDAERQARQAEKEQAKEAKRQASDEQAVRHRNYLLSVGVESTDNLTNREAIRDARIMARAEIRDMDTDVARGILATIRPDLPTLTMKTAEIKQILRGEIDRFIALDGRENIQALKSAPSMLERQKAIVERPRKQRMAKPKSFSQRVKESGISKDTVERLGLVGEFKKILGDNYRFYVRKNGTINNMEEFVAEYATEDNSYQGTVNGFIDLFERDLQTKDIYSPDDETALKNWQENSIRAEREQQGATQDEILQAQTYLAQNKIDTTGMSNEQILSEAQKMWNQNNPELMDSDITVEDLEEIPDEFFGQNIKEITDLADENARLDDIYPAYDGETIRIIDPTELKQAQNEVIQRTNPMQDEYHVGIRSVNDIKTFDETIDDKDSFVWGDYSQEDAKRDLAKNEITIYSSKPIENGVFVSTSYRQAQEYAGSKGAKVYKKTVPLDYVAWISGDEGEFAITDVVGKKRSVYNSNGERIAKSEPALRNFYKWFGDSKAVDADGKPLVLYHGARGKSDITEFRPQEYGYNVDATYFATNKRAAGHWAESSYTKRNINPDEYMKKVYETDSVKELLDMYNSFGAKTEIVEYDGFYRLNEHDGMISSPLGKKITESTFEVNGRTIDLVKDLQRKISRIVYDSANSDLYSVYAKLDNPLVVDAKKNPYWKIEYDGTTTNTETIATKAKAKGYDGVIVKNVYETDYENVLTDDVLVFNSDQIKSTDNRGTYSSDTPNIYYQVAYAGSRVDYDRPSLEAIGSGEGAAAHGWGLYYALNPEIAEQYRMKLSGPSNTHILYKGQEIPSSYASSYSVKQNLLYEIALNFDSHNFSIKDTIDYMLKHTKKEIADWESYIEKGFAKENPSVIEDRIAVLKASIKELESFDLKDFKKSVKGQVHEVDIPEMDVLLDEQEAFSKQSPYIKKALERMLYDDAFKEFHQTDAEDFAEIELTDWELGFSGGNIYDRISNLLGSDKAASQLMEKYGIKGITYDGRQDGRCFVIFNPESVKVLRKKFDELGNQLFQQKTIGAWNPLRKTIELGTGANETTLPHELSHFWLDNMMMYSRMASAAQNEGFARVWNNIKRYLDIDDRQDVVNAAQAEKYTSAYMQYIRNNKTAPVSDLGFKGLDEYIGDISLDYFENAMHKEADGTYTSELENLTPEIVDALQALTTTNLQGYKDIIIDMQMSESPTEDITDAKLGAEATPDQMRTSGISEMRAQQNKQIEQGIKAAEADAQPIETPKTTAEMKTAEETNAKIPSSRYEIGTTDTESFEKAREIIAKDRNLAEQTVMENPSGVTEGIANEFIALELAQQAVQQGRNATPYLESFVNGASASGANLRVASLLNTPEFAWAKDMYEASKARDYAIALRMRPSVKNALMRRSSIVRAMESKLDEYVETLYPQLLQAQSYEEQVKLINDWGNNVAKEIGVQPSTEMWFQTIGGNVGVKKTDFGKAVVYQKRKLKDFLKSKIGASLSDAEQLKVRELHRNAIDSLRILNTDPTSRDKRINFIQQTRAYQDYLNALQPSNWATSLFASIPRASMLFRISTQVKNTIGTRVEILLSDINRNLRYGKDNLISDKDITAEIKDSMDMYSIGGFSPDVQESFFESPTLAWGEKQFSLIARGGEKRGAVLSKERLAQDAKDIAEYARNNWKSDDPAYKKAWGATRIALGTLERTTGKSFDILAYSDAFMKADVAVKESAKMATFIAKIEGKEKGWTHDQMKARAYELFADARSFIPKTTVGQSIRKRAVEQAKLETFIKSGTLSQVANNIRNSLNLGKESGIGTFIAPFVSTPANVMQLGVDYATGWWRRFGTQTITKDGKTIELGWKECKQRIIDNVKTGKPINEYDMEYLEKGYRGSYGGLFLLTMMALFAGAKALGDGDEIDYVPPYQSLNDRERQYYKAVNGGKYNCLKIGDVWVNAEYFGGLSEAITALGTWYHNNSLISSLTTEFMRTPVIGDLVETKQDFDRDIKYNKSLLDSAFEGAESQLKKYIPGIIQDIDRAREKGALYVAFGGSLGITTDSEIKEVKDAQTESGASYTPITRGKGFKDLDQSTKRKINREFDELYNADVAKWLKSHKNAKPEVKKTALNKIRKDITTKLKHKYKIK